MCSIKSRSIWFFQFPPKWIWEALGTFTYIVHVCGLLLTVPLLTMIMFQNASSWRLVFSTKSLAEQKLKSLVTSLNDLTQWTTQTDTLLALRCFCWKNSGKNVSRRSYYWWICPLPPYILCFWHGPEVLSKVRITTRGPCLMLMMVPENNRVKWKSHCVRTTHKLDPSCELFSKNSRQLYRPNWSEILRQVMLILLSLNQNHALIAKSVLGEDPL